MRGTHSTVILPRCTNPDTKLTLIPVRQTRLVTSADNLIIYKEDSLTQTLSLRVEPRYLQLAKSLIPRVHMGPEQRHHCAKYPVLN